MRGLYGRAAPAHPGAMETLRYRFDLREFDVLGAGNRLAWRNGGWVPLVLYVAGIAAAGAAVALWPGRASPWLPLAWVVGGWAIFPLHAARVWRHAARGPLFAGPARLRLDPEGYLRHSPLARSEGRWAMVEDVIEMRRHLVIRFGTGSILPVRHADLAPLDPAEAAARIRGWIAGAPGGAPIEIVDRIAPGEAGPLIVRANRHRPRLSAGRQAFFGALGFLAVILLVGTAEALGLPGWARLALLAAAFGAILWTARRDLRRGGEALRRAAPFRGMLEVALAPAGWAVTGDGWRLSGPWSDGLRLVPVRGAAALQIGRSFFVPIPAAALAPDTPKEVARHVNRGIETALRARR